MKLRVACTKPASLVCRAQVAQLNDMGVWRAKLKRPAVTHIAQPCTRVCFAPRVLPRPSPRSTSPTEAHGHDPTTAAPGSQQCYMLWAHRPRLGLTRADLPGLLVPHGGPQVVLGCVEQPHLLGLQVQVAQDGKVPGSWGGAAGRWRKVGGGRHGASNCEWVGGRLEGSVVQGSVG